METLSDITRKANKAHICDFCNTKINKGERYHIQTNVADNDIWTWKSHISCKEIARKLKMFDECDEGGS